MKVDQSERCRANARAMSVRIASRSHSQESWTSFRGLVTYDPFGGALSSEGAAAGVNPIRFTGQYLDGSALYHLRARQYTASMGRFTSVDPWSQPIQWSAASPYPYVQNLPTLLTDPSGRCPICIGVVVGAAIGAISAAAGGGDGGDILAGAVTGAGTGLLGGAGVLMKGLSASRPILAGALVGGGAGMAGSIGGQGFSQGFSNIDGCKVASATLVGAGGGALGGVFSFGAGSIAGEASAAEAAEALAMTRSAATLGTFASSVMSGAGEFFVTGTVCR